MVITAGRTAQLDRLDAEVARLADLARGAPAPEHVAAAAHERTVVATLQLDGSPIRELPDHLDVPAGGGDRWASGTASASASGTAPGAPGSTSASGTALGAPGATSRSRVEPAYGQPSSWYTSFELLADAPDEAIIALEASGVASAYASADLVPKLAEQPLTALGELQRRLTHGLLDPVLAGAPRTTDQAVQDTTIGRVLYAAVDPAEIADELERLAAWMAGAATRFPPLHAAGLLHLELLRIHPFEAANGRLARVAARLWLRRGDLDPHGLAVAEAELATDRLGYHEEVAATLRRRDAGIWLERWAEAVAAGLRRSVREAGWLEIEPPRRARAFLAEHRSGDTFTVADYRTHLRGDVAVADADLGRLVDAGAVTRVPGSRGLRFTVA